MNKIINFSEFLKNKHLKEEVIPFVKNLKISFNYYLSNNNGVFILKNNLYFFVFLKYIPKNELTEMPSIEDRFYNTKHKPRVSNGEWVVETIYELDYIKSNQLINEIKNKSQNIDKVSFLKDKLSN